MKNKVLVAMGIGIFAALTFNAASVTTLADTDPEPKAPEGDPEEKVTSAQAIDNAETKASDASLDINNSVGLINETIGAEENLVSEADAVLDDDAEGRVYKDIDPIADNLKAELDNNGDKTNPLADVQEDMAKVNKDLLDLDAQDSVITNFNNCDPEAKAVNDTVDKADKLVEEANKLFEPDPVNGTPSLDDEIADTNKIVDQAAKDIAGANSQAEADAAMDTAQKAVDNVSKKVDAAEKRVGEIEGELSKLEEEDKTNRKAYNDQVDLLHGAENRFSDLKVIAETDAAELLAEIKRLEGGDAKNNNTNGINDLKNKVDTLNYDESGYATIRKIEDDLNANKGTKSVTDYRKLTWAIMRYYYVPDVLGGKMNTEFDAFNRDWKTFSGDYTYTDENGAEHTSTKGDVLNYGVVKYTDKNDEAATLYINYKTANGNTLNSRDFAGLVIFEKVPHLAIDDKDITDAFIKTIDANGYYIDEETGHIYGKDKNGYFRFNDNGITTDGDPIPEDEIEEVEGLSLADGVSKNDVVVGDEKVAYDLIDGQLTKIVSKDVTTTTYTGVSLTTTANDSIGAHAATLDSETAARNAFIAAVQEKINALGDNQTITIGDGDNKKEYKKGDTATDAGFELDKDAKTTPGTEITGYKLTVNYNQKFTETVEVSGISDNHGQAQKDCERKIKEAKEELAFKYGYRDGAEAIGTGIVNFFTGNWGKLKDSYNQETELLTFDAPDKSNQSIYTTTNKEKDTYNCSVTAFYSKLSTMKVGKSFLIFTGGDVDKEATAAKLAAEGKKLVDVDMFDGELDAYTVYYYIDDASKEITISGTSADSITDEAVRAALVNAGVNEGNLNISYNKNSAKEQTKEMEIPITKYGYKALIYLLSTTTVNTQATSTVTDTYTVSTTVYAPSNVKAQINLRNDNWYSGNILLCEKDYENNQYTTDGREGDATKNVSVNEKDNDKFRHRVDGVGRIPTALTTLADKAQKSQEALAKAEGEVIELQKQIAALESKGTPAKIKQLNTDLTKAKEKLNQLIAERNELVQKLNDLDPIYRDKINELNQTPDVPTTIDDVIADAIAVDPLAFAAAADDALADDFVAAPIAAPAGAVLGANRPLETLGSVRSGSVLGERRGPQSEVLGKRRSPKTADGAMGGMVAGMMLSMMSAFGGARVLKKKREDEE